MCVFGVYYWFGVLMFLICGFDLFDDVLVYGCDLILVIYVYVVEFDCY